MFIYVFSEKHWHVQMCTRSVKEHMQHMSTIFGKYTYSNIIGGSQKSLSSGLGRREGGVTVGTPVVHQPCCHALELAGWSCTLMLVHMECATWCVIWQQYEQKRTDLMRTAGIELGISRFIST